MKFITKLAMIGATTLAMALPASAAFASTSHTPNPHPTQTGYPGNQGGNNKGKSCQDNWGWQEDGHYLPGPVSISCLPFCHDEVVYVTETVWVREGWREVRKTERIREYKEVCTTGNQGGGQGNGGGSQGGGYNGGGGQGGGYSGGGGSGQGGSNSSCTLPETTTVSSTGTNADVITYDSGYVLKNGDEVTAYGTTDYWVFDVSNGTPETFELSTTPPSSGNTVHVNNDVPDWALQLVSCTPAAA